MLRTHLIALLLLAVPAVALAKAPPADAHAFVHSWVDAQNHGDFAAYSKLYAPSFHGVRRSGADRKTELDHDGWLRDRAHMFKKPVKVTAESVKVTSTDPLTVELVQTFASGNFHDRGRKRLTLVEKQGALVITREEMLESLLPTDSGPCEEQKRDTPLGPLVLKSCVTAERAREYGTDQMRKVTASFAGKTIALDDVGSGWEWEEKWYIEAVLRSTGKSATPAVMLVRRAQGVAGDEYDDCRIQVRLLAPGLPLVWQNDDRMFGVEVSTVGDATIVSAVHAAKGALADEASWKAFWDKHPYDEPTRTSFVFHDGSVEMKTLPPSPSR